MPIRRFPPIWRISRVTRAAAAAADTVVNPGVEVDAAVVVDVAAADVDVAAAAASRRSGKGEKEREKPPQETKKNEKDILLY